MRRSAYLILCCVSLVLIIGVAIFTAMKPAGDQPYFIGTFTEKKAMTALFDNFDESKQGSVWSNVPIGKLPKDAAGDDIRSIFDVDGKQEAQGFAKVFKVFQPLPSTRYLFFSAIDAGNGGLSGTESPCHACGVLLGGAVFERHGMFWSLRDKNLFLGKIGSWGKPPEVAQLAQWMSGNYGLLVTGNWNGQGVSTEGTEFFGFNGQHLSRVFSTTTSYDDCETGENPCESWKASPRFVTMDGPYDVLLESKDNRTASDAQSSRFHFNGSTYVDTEFGLPIESYDLIRKAKNGDASAALEIGRSFLADHDSVLKDYKMAGQWFQKAITFPTAKSRIIGEAMNEIGLMYSRGQGMPQDEAIAREWFVKAYQQGNGGAACSLAYSYLEGTPHDYEAALQWFRRAADLNIQEAVNGIGVIYANGYGVPKDEQEALKWFLKATDMGSAEAANNTAVMYANQYGANSVVALAAFSKAAQMGSAEAQRNLNSILAGLYEPPPVIVGGHPQYVETPADAERQRQATQEIQESVGRARQYLNK